ncbi:DUF502 domain-containing protein [Sulfurimonas sp. HSL1-2]|uniref:DUF502 domain-containing protein n=1 Tax=Thiomicrolovo zhangzhouensis TaxID=3131933 RepID=UPI0031FA22AC
MIAAAVKKMIRFLFVGALSFFPLVVVLLVVNFLKNIGLSAYLRLNTLTDSADTTVLLMFGVLGALILLGWTIERYGRSVLLSAIDRMFEKIPAVNTIYSVSRKISNMLTGKDDSGKKEVVLVEYPKEGVWVPAYVLNRHNGICVLFVPTSPNPTSGYTVLVKDELTVPVSLTLEEASSFIISMGADFTKRDEVTEKIHAAGATPRP